MKQNARLKLVCRDNSNMVLRVIKEDVSNSTSFNNNEKQLYLIKVQEDEQANKEWVIYLVCIVVNQFIKSNNLCAIYL